MGPRNRSSSGITRVTIMGASVARSACQAPLSLLYQSARGHFALPDTRGWALSGPQFLPLHNKDDVLHGLRGPQALASTCRGIPSIVEPGKPPLGGSPAAVSSSACPPDPELAPRSRAGRAAPAGAAAGATWHSVSGNGAHPQPGPGLHPVWSTEASEGRLLEQGSVTPAREGMLETPPSPPAPPLSPGQRMEKV